MTWRHLRTTTPIARKDHTCFLCERVILRGETHVLRVGENSDGLMTMRMHAACEALTKRWSNSDWASHDAATFREDMSE